MSETITRNMSIRAVGLTNPCKLLFSFQPLSGIGDDLLRQCWKVIDFPANSARIADVKFVNQLVFISPQRASGNLIEPLTFAPVKPGGAVKFIADADHVISIVPTDQNAKENMVVAKNDTDFPLDIQIGLLPSANAAPEPVLFFAHVPPSFEVDAKFTPILSAYVLSHVQSPVLVAEVLSPVILKQNLFNLDLSTSWKLTYDSTKGTHQLSQTDNP